MAYTTAQNIYDYTPLTESDVNSTTLSRYIEDATAQLNKEINSKIIRERVKPINSIKENLINGSNRFYYVQKTEKGVYFSDMNDDGEVTVDDVIVHLVNADDTETIATVTSIDHEDMKITLDQAPASNTQAIYITYSYSYFDVTIPDKLIEMATRYLAASYGFMKTQYGLGDNVKVGNISVSGINKKNDYLSMHNRYEDILIKIKTFSNGRNLPVRHIRI